MANKAGAIAFLFIAIVLFSAWSMGGTGGSLVAVPSVVYIEPASDSTVDLTSKEKLVFRWQPVPIPGGDRNSYRFLLNKEPGYNTIAKVTLGPEIFSIEAPADKFENGSRYSWHVKQRDDKTLDWSLYDIWYFKVVKK